MTERPKEEPATPFSGWTTPVRREDGGRLTRASKLAALILGLLGVGFSAVGALIVMSAVDASYLTSQFGQGARAVFVSAGAVVTALAVVEVVAAIGVWAGRGWGRILGLLYAIVFGTGSLLVLVGSLDRSPAPIGVALALGWFLVYAFVAVTLVWRWKRTVD